MKKKIEKKIFEKLFLDFFLLINVSGPVRKTSGFRTARTFKICRTSGPDLMSGWALILIVVAEWEIKLLHSYLFCLTYKKYTQIANIQESLCITLQILVHLALYLQFKLAGWYENPIKSVVLTFPIEDIVFPTVTLCPEDSRPDRWGSVIKIFDQLNTDCGPQRWD